MEIAVKELVQYREITLELKTKIDEFERFGFSNCQNVMNLHTQLQRANYDRYKHKYPTYLFFADEKFNEIVTRNRLVISTCETYIGYIPEHCFENVKNENVQKEDFRENRYKVIIKSSATGFAFNFNCDESKKDRIAKWSKEDIEWEIRKNNPDFTYHDVREILYSKNNAIFPHTYSRDRDDCVFDISFEHIDTDYSKLHIAAPANVIDSKKKKTFLEKITITRKTQPLDPIVFRYVKDGILVITFWK